MSILLAMAMGILILLTIFFLVCAMVLGANDDKETQKLMEQLKIKEQKKGEDKTFIIKRVEQNKEENEAKK